MAFIMHKQCSMRHFVRRPLTAGFTQSVRFNHKNDDTPTLYSAKKGVSRDFLFKIQQPIDFSPDGYRKWKRKKQWEAIKEDQKYDSKRQTELGYDLSVAHFVVARGGAVKFKGSDRWIERNEEGKYHLPNTRIANLFVEAVDCSNLNIMYDSFDHFKNVKELRYLKLSGCVHVDDYCMDRLVMLENTLMHLDLSGCPNISERGLVAIHKLKRLRILEISNMAMVKNPALIGLMIEDALPNCKVIDVDYTNIIQDSTESSPEIPGFVKNIENFFEAKKQPEPSNYLLDGLFIPKTETKT